MSYSLYPVNGSDYRYGPWVISYDPKPIPASCGVDWNWAHEDYEGPDDKRYGNERSLEACIQAIHDWESDHEPAVLDWALPEQSNAREEQLRWVGIVVSMILLAAIVASMFADG